MADMKTPGVYVVEQNAFPNSVVQVETAVPAFIGYTLKANNQGKSLLNVPFRISSAAEFAEYFGGAPTPVFYITEIPSSSAPGKNVIPLKGKDYAVTCALKLEQQFLLYASMQLFFQNGGAACYIVSVGDYSAAIDPNQLTMGIDLLEKQQEPTLVVIPDAMHLPEEATCINVQQHALKHCGNVMKNRLAILDIYDGFQNNPQADPIANFRADIGTEFLDFAAAYYPWIETNVFQPSNIGYTCLESKQLAALLTAEAALPADVISEVIKLNKFTESSLNATLPQRSKVYKSILQEILRQLNTLPPSGAIAGIYTRVDSTQGVWKAPANTGIFNCVAPTVNVSDKDQQALNVDVLEGKSINAIRNFSAQGTLVWGARTLDGNSIDWRYINVRRTMIMLEQSILLAAKAYVFEPNEAATWSTIKTMIQNFLTGIWKQGGLVGSAPADAFSVSCGLGETMTAQDILVGILRVTVLVAVTRPAEFIEITFQQQMQKS
jgi:hypothetical protein